MVLSPRSSHPKRWGGGRRGGIIYAVIMNKICAPLRRHFRSQVITAHPFFQQRCVSVFTVLMCEPHIVKLNSQYTLKNQKCFSESLLFIVPTSASSLTTLSLPPSLPPSPPRLLPLLLISSRCAVYLPLAACARCHLPEQLGHLTRQIHTSPMDYSSSFLQPVSVHGRVCLRVRGGLIGEETKMEGRGLAVCKYFSGKRLGVGWSANRRSRWQSFFFPCLLY